LSEDLKDEMKKLKEELANLREQLKEVTKTQSKEGEKEKHRGIVIDFGNRIQDYVEDALGGMEEGIQGELEKSVFIGPRGIRIYRKEPFEEEKINFAKASSAMNALGNEHRLKILKNLMYGGRYISELQEALPEITSSTLSSHLDILQEAGLVVQEKTRGRHLVTMPGRIAYKMANKIARLLEREQNHNHDDQSTPP
jgi:DNA-binding HxlR family transcriptional regulator